MSKIPTIHPLWCFASSFASLNYIQELGGQMEQTEENFQEVGRRSAKMFKELMLAESANLDKIQSDETVWKYVVEDVGKQNTDILNGTFDMNYLKMLDELGAVYWVDIEKVKEIAEATRH